MRIMLSEMLGYLANASLRDLVELALMAIAGQIVFWGLLLAMAWLLHTGTILLAIAFLLLIVLYAWE